MTTTDATPQWQVFRQERLIGDWHEMQNIRCSMIDWVAEGKPPSRYFVTYRLRSYVGPSATRDVHLVRFELGLDYPHVGPTPFMIDTPVVFHPNVFEDGRICTGQGFWTPTEGLAFLVLRVAKMLLYFDVMTNPTSAANGVAAAWYLANRSRFPIDRFVAFPDPITGASAEAPRLTIVRRHSVSR